MFATQAGTKNFVAREKRKIAVSFDLVTNSSIPIVLHKNPAPVGLIAPSSAGVSSTAPSNTSQHWRGELLSEKILHLASLAHDHTKLLPRSQFAVMCLYSWEIMSRAIT